MHSYRAAPAQSASLCVMAAVPGSGGSRTTTVGTNLGCAACNPYPTPSCTLRRRVPPRHHHPLHAATTLYTLPPPSTCPRRRPLRATPAAPMCHHQPHHWPLPLCVAPPLSVAFVHMPRAAWAPQGAHCHCMCLAHVHTSHMGPHATPLCPPCLSPIPGPICGGALRLSPHRMHPHPPGPICGCAPRLSPCRVRPHLLGPIHGHATRSRDRVRVAFVCHWVAHTHRESMGNCTVSNKTDRMFGSFGLCI